MISFTFRKNVSTCRVSNWRVQAFIQCVCEYDWIATQKSKKGHTNRDETVKCAKMRIIPSLKDF